MKKTWKIDIDCPNCAAKVERALQKLPGVVDASVNYVQKKITLEAADERFEEVRKAAYAKMKEIEPDAEIFFDEAEEPSGASCPCGGHHHEDDDDDEHEHHHHHDGECGCGHDHHHHDDNDHDEHEHHDHDNDEDGLDHSHCDHEHGHCCHHDHDHEDGEEEYGIGSFVYHRIRPFNQDKLQQFVENWPKSVVRAKGVLWFDDKREDVYVFEQAGVQITATEQGKWLAAFPKKQQKLYLAEYPDMAEKWDEKYGDREIKLVFIGQHMDRHAIVDALDECLSD